MKKKIYKESIRKPSDFNKPGTEYCCYPTQNIRQLNGLFPQYHKVQTKYPLLLKTDSLYINVALTRENDAVKLTTLPFYEW